MRTGIPAILALAVIAAACTPMEYTKPGVTDETLQTDLEECAEIARRQAFRDSTVGLPPRRDVLDPFPHRMFDRFDNDDLRYSELQLRYRRICMLARGYELRPVEEP